MFNKKPIEVIPNDTWVLCRVAAREGGYSYDRRTDECHAGQVAYCDGAKGYAVRFHFGVRWLDRANMDLVTREVAAFTVPVDVRELESERAYLATNSERGIMLPRKP